MAKQATATSSNSADDKLATADQTSKPVKKKKWIYGIFVFFAAIAYFYFQHLTVVETRINRDFYRVLFEATNQFNHNLEKLHSMIDDVQSPNAIKSILPSFKSDKNANSVCNKKESVEEGQAVNDNQSILALEGEEVNKLLVKGSINQSTNNIRLNEVRTQSSTEIKDISAKVANNRQGNGKEKGCKVGYYLEGNEILVKKGGGKFASLKIDNLIPKPSSGFSLYLVADENGNVISQLGEEKRISITNLQEIDRALRKKNKGVSLNLYRIAESKEKVNSDSLPTTSEHVDMKLSYGEFRVFVFPFQLDKALLRSDKIDEKQNDKGVNFVSEIEQSAEADSNSDANNKVSRLYLIGVLPKHTVEKASMGKWNIPAIVLTISLAIFCFLLFQLVLMPRSTAVSRGLAHSVTLAFSLVLFLLAAFLLTTFQASNREHDQDLQLVKYLQKMNNALSHDVWKSFDELKRHETVYLKLYERLLALSSGQSDQIIKYDTDCYPYVLDSNDILPNSTLYMNVEDLPIQDDNPVAKNNSSAGNIECNDTSQLNELWGKNGELLGRLKDAFNTPKADLPSGIIAANGMSIALEPTVIEPTATEPTEGDATEEALNSDLKENTIAKKYTITKKTISPQKKQEKLSGKFKHDGIVSTFYANENTGSVAGQDFIGASNNLLSVLLMQKDGTLFLPSIRYREYNSAPSTVNLSYRKYFSDVFNRKGVTISGKSEHFQEHRYSLSSLTSHRRERTDLKDKEDQLADLVEYNAQMPYFSNVAVQRLFNKHNGTRGITISKVLDVSMNGGGNNQLIRHSDHYKDNGPFVIAADVLFDQTNFRLDDEEQTRRFMVLNRHTGDVVFHSDENRVLVDNLFQDNARNKALVNYIQSSALTQRNHDMNEIRQGLFHGEQMRFAVDNTIYPDWVMVAYYPEDVIKSFIDVQFILILSLMVFPLLIVLSLWGLKQLFRRITNKDDDSLEYTNNTAWTLIEFVCLTVSIGMFIVVLGRELYLFSMENRVLFWFVYLCAGLLFIFAVVKLTESVFSKEIRNIKGSTLYRFIRRQTKRNLQAKTFCIRLPVMVTTISYLIFTHSFIGIWDVKLTHYYESIELAEKYREHEELTQMGKTLYPNSIARFEYASETLLLDGANAHKGVGSSSDPKVYPSYIPSLSSVDGIGHVWRDMYQFKFSPVWNIFEPKSGVNQSMNNWYMFWTLLAFVFLVSVWCVIGRDVLYARIYLVREKLDALKQLSLRDKLNFSIASPKAKVVYFDKMENAAFVELSRFMGVPTKISTSVGVSSAIARLSDLLRESGIAVSELTNAKIAFKSTIDSTETKYIDITSYNNLINLTNMEIVLTGIESGINDKYQRKELLALIILLKCLADEGTIAGFSILADEHTFKCVDTKSNFVHDSESSLSRDEYLAWSNCLMNFSVTLAVNSDNNDQIKDLHDEISAELAAFNIKLDTVSGRQDGCQAQKFDGNFVKRLSLLVAEPFYRFYWEMCNNEEKLALYYLAKNGVYNPKNMYVLESLALNGLITLEKEKVVLVNKSFAEFIVNAEPKSILDELILKGEEGAWKDHRAPIGLVILLIIGGIALTSGESFYLIAVTLSGLLTTIVSISNNANLLRGVGSS